MPSLAIRGSVFALLILTISAATRQALPRSHQTALTQPRTDGAALTQVKEVGTTYNPVRVTVRQGDTVRFVQASSIPHNVKFRGAPDGVDVGSLPEGPYLNKVGETWDLVIGKEFKPGKYVYVCTPHETIGMTAILNVSP